MSLACHCYCCNVENSANSSYFSEDNEDKQSLVLQICKRIFDAIQNNHTSTEIPYNGSKMLHKQIRNINQVENCINEVFNQLFINNVLRKEVKKLSIGIWKIEFKWNTFDNDSLIKGLLEISSDWYKPFTDYLQKIDDQKRNELFGSDISGEIDNLKNSLPGFEYLFEYSWKSYDDDDDNYHQGDFIFASDFGIFIVVKAKWLNVGHGRKSGRKNVRNQSSEEFNGKYITLLKAKITNNLDLDANASEKAILEFTDDDENIVKCLKEIYLKTRKDNNKTKTKGPEEGWGATASIAAIATASYIIYRAFSGGNRGHD